MSGPARTVSFVSKDANSEASGLEGAPDGLAAVGRYELKISLPGDVLDWLVAHAYEERIVDPDEAADFDGEEAWLEWVEQAAAETVLRAAYRRSVTLRGGDGVDPASGVRG